MATAQTSFSRIRGTRKLVADSRFGLVCGLAGLLVSALFSFLIYPRIAGMAGAALDPDGHGALGWGLYKLHTFSFYPNNEPTLTRGPLYPMAVAAILELTPHAWPFNVQLIQDFWCGITCALTFEIGRRLFDSRTGLMAGMLCAFYPLLVWYSARIWIETMTILLFTAFVLASLCFMEQPSLWRGVMVGLLIGALCLSKGTFLPFLLVIPLYFLVFGRQTGLLPIATIPLIAVLAVLPWTVRNWMLTGRIIPVHGQAGFNLRIGDLYAAHAQETNYNFLPHWERGTAEAAAIFQKSRAQGDPGWLAEIKVNDGMLHSSFETYAAHPFFPLKKMFMNSIGFWMLSETRTKSIVSGLMHVPLLAAFFIAMFRLVRARRITPVLALPLVIITIYYLSHLPFLGAVRYSSVIVPVMLAYAVGGCTLASPVAITPEENPL